LDELSEEALVDILVKPKNALVKQYNKIFEFENVKLKFQQDALWAVAKEAINRKSGARALRAILEDAMLDIMYDIPSQENIKECIIGEEVILKREKPLILYESKTKSA
jgi:ATP-dependent Clp protease ATP-binding subunit ClpX